VHRGDGSANSQQRAGTTESNDDPPTRHPRARHGDQSQHCAGTDPRDEHGDDVWRDGRPDAITPMGRLTPAKRRTCVSPCRSPRSRATEEACVGKFYTRRPIQGDLNRQTRNCPDRSISAIQAAFPAAAPARWAAATGLPRCHRTWGGNVAGNRPTTATGNPYERDIIRMVILEYANARVKIARCVENIYTSHNLSRR
jgi:hypothetical protein